MELLENSLPEAEEMVTVQTFLPILHTMAEA